MCESRLEAAQTNGVNPHDLITPALAQSRQIAEKQEQSIYFYMIPRFCISECHQVDSRCAFPTVSKSLYLPQLTDY